MKAFDCDFCALKAKAQDTVVKWHYDASKKLSCNFQVVHDRVPCNVKGEGAFFNRSLPLLYVFKNMPEFLYFVSRHEVNKKELKKFTERVEKDRSYIRRHTVDKKEVKKLIIRMEGMGEG